MTLKIYESRYSGGIDRNEHMIVDGILGHVIVYAIQSKKQVDARENEWF